MNILITDFLFVDAHSTVNLNIIRLIATISDKVSLLSVNNYYSSNKSELSQLGINIIEKQVSGTRYGLIKGRVYITKIMNLTAKIAREGNYDLVVSLAYDSIAAVFGKFLFPSKKICLFNHKNIDELSNPIIRCLFKVYRNKYIHLVFEKPFGDYLSEVHRVKYIHVIPHPLIVNATLDVIDHTSFDCVALCNSNDENMLDSLANLYDPAKDRISILARSKKVRANKGGLIFFKGSVEYQKYYSLLANSRCVFVPLPEKYKFRLSASIYDALSLRKPVITTSKFYADGLDSQYPGVCKYVSCVTDLLEVLKAGENIIENENSFNLFIEQHSEVYIKKSLIKLFNDVLLS